MALQDRLTEMVEDKLLESRYLLAESRRKSRRLLGMLGTFALFGVATFVSDAVRGSLSWLGWASGVLAILMGATLLLVAHAGAQRTIVERCRC